MATVTLTDPVAGTVVTAGLHVTNNSALRAALNGGLDTANWASGLIFAPSKIMQEGATKFQGLRWGGSTWAPADTPTIYGTRLAAAVDVANTAVETTLYSQVITGNDLGTKKRVTICATGDFLHNNVAGDTVTLRFKFGSATITGTATSLGGTTNANRRAWKTVGPEANLVANQLATNAQQIGFHIHGNAADGTTLAWQTFGYDLAAIDTTADQTLSLTVQWSAASANNSFRIREAWLLIV